MKKGRHRRFEEARALKRSPEAISEPCAECGADPEDDHASWCMAGEDSFEEVYGDVYTEDQQVEGRVSTAKPDEDSEGGSAVDQPR